MHTDPIADMLNRLKLASTARKIIVDIPSSKLKENILKILEKEGYIKFYRLLEDKKSNILRVHLAYTPDNHPLINGVKRISKPGRRLYVKHTQIPKVLSGYGTAIISTPKGVLTDKECITQKTGGEVLCYIW